MLDTIKDVPTLWRGRLLIPKEASSGQSRQAVGSAGAPAVVAPAAAPALAANDVLMTRLQAKLDRLCESQKRAKDSGRDIDKYSTQIEVVEKEIDDLENVLLDLARVAAKAESL
jgi:hypothetical protein